MIFKHFDHPEFFTGLKEPETNCDICRQNKLCFDAELFYGADNLASVCPECLASGQLKKKDVFTCIGDKVQLSKQIRRLNPALGESEIENIVKQKTIELEKTTPRLLTWQDWNWPCAEGDYCKFIGYGSKPFYKELAKEIPTQDFFRSSFYELDSYNDDLWSILPESKIKTYHDSNQYSTLFYVFKSLNSDKIVTIWDCN